MNKKIALLSTIVVQLEWLVNCYGRILRGCLLSHCAAFLIYSQAALNPSIKTSLFPAKRHHLRQHFSLREKPLKTFAYGKSHAVRVRFPPVTPAGVQSSGMLGRAVNAKHLRPGLPVRQHFSRCEKPPFGCPAFLPLPLSLPLGKRLRIFAFDPPQKTLFFGDPGAKTRKRRPLRATGIFRFADGFLLSVLCLAAKILRFTGTLLKRPDYIFSQLSQDSSPCGKAPYYPTFSTAFRHPAPSCSLGYLRQCESHHQSHLY